MLAEIAAAAELSDRDRVLEIGPGTGVLTRRLLPLAGAVVAVEIDRNLCDRLRTSFGHCESFHLIEGDFLRLNLDTAVGEPLPNKVVANIPYNITSPILDRLLGAIARPNRSYETIVLLVQKEIGDRLCASPSTKSFGALSVRSQYLAECQLITQVPAKAFSPPPKVDSVVVRLQPRPYPLPVAHPKHLETLVKLGFANRRKMLRNNLKSLIESDRLSPLLEHLGINPQARAEELGVPEWIALSDRLVDFED